MADPAKPCLPVDNNYFLMESNPFTDANGWGWLKEGECGCYANGPGWNATNKGCSVRALRKGPNSCPNCAPAEEPINWMLWGGLGLAAIILLTPKRR